MNRYPSYSSSSSSDSGSVEAYHDDTLPPLQFNAIHSRNGLGSSSQPREQLECEIEERLDAIEHQKPRGESLYKLIDSLNDLESQCDSARSAPAGSSHVRTPQLRETSGVVSPIQQLEDVGYGFWVRFKAVVPNHETESLDISPSNCCACCVSSIRRSHPKYEDGADHEMYLKNQSGCIKPEFKHQARC